MSEIQLQATVVFQQIWAAINCGLLLDEDGHTELDDLGRTQRAIKYIILEGSSRSSKTRSCIDCYDLYAREQEDKRLTVWRDTKTDCKKTVLSDMLKHLKKNQRYEVDQVFNKTESIFTYSTSSTVEIHGTDDAETVHGLDQDAAWLNEPYKISRDTFDQIDQRTSDFIFVDWNPKKSHWIDDLKKDKRAITIYSTFKHNPFCPPEQRAKILSYQPVSMCDIVLSEIMTEEEAKNYDIRSNPKGITDKQIRELVRCIDNEYKRSSSEFNWSVYGLGKKAERPNRILRMVKITDDHYKNIDAERVIGVDWGSVHPWGILESKVYDNSLYLHELNYLSENEWRPKLSAHERMEMSKPTDEAGNKDGLVLWLFKKLNIPKDLLIICDNNRPSKILALRDAGYDYAIAALKPPGSVLDGLDLMNDITVYYTESSENLHYEQENYSRKVDKYGEVQEEPEDEDNHLIDPARYIAMHHQREGTLKGL